MLYGQRMLGLCACSQRCHHPRAACPAHFLWDGIVGLGLVSCRERDGQRLLLNQRINSSDSLCLCVCVCGGEEGKIRRG